MGDHVSATGRNDDCFFECTFPVPRDEPRGPLERQRPGALVYAEDLARAGVSIEDLQRVPLPLLVMSLRDLDLNTFSVDVLRQLDPDARAPDMLAWAADLTPALASFVGLTLTSLLEEGLQAEHVRAVGWPYQRWRDTFGLTEAHVRHLGMASDPQAFFGPGAPSFAARAGGPVFFRL
jgi:hypothetical protein